MSFEPVKKAFSHGQLVARPFRAHHNISYRTDALHEPVAYIIRVSNVAGVCLPHGVAFEAVVHKKRLLMGRAVETLHRTMVR
jgi:hypothetical protein